MSNLLGRLAIPAALALASLGPSVSYAQPEPPNVHYVFPPGGQRGQTFEAIIGGERLLGAEAVRISGQGVTIELIEVKEPDPDEKPDPIKRPVVVVKRDTARIKVTIAADAPLGSRDVRIVSPNGVSNRHRFLVGEIPELNELEPNESQAEAQQIASLPVTVNGQLIEGDVDFVRFEAKAGQTLVCDVHARKLVPYVADAVPGWMQTCLTLYDAQGKEVAYVDDFRFHPDPVLIYEVEKDGPYVLEIRDVIYRGREDMAYRLSIGVLPYLTHIYPLGSQRGSATDVRLYGANLEKETLSVTPTADGPRVQPVQVTSQGLSSNPRSFAAGTIDEAEDAEPNDSIDEPQRVTLPTTVNGHIGAPGDTDCFVFAAKANQRVFLDVQARRLGSPVDSILTLFDPNGREVIENDDSVDKSSPLITHHADSRLNYLCTTEGDYTLRLRDIQGKGGEEYAYRLSIGSTTPDFDLLIIPDNPRVGKGGTVALTAKALRTWGAWGDITLSVQGLPDGFAVSDAAITARQNEVHLTLTAPADAPLGVVTPTFIGTGTFGQKTVVRNAVGAEAIMQAFIYWHDVPTEEFLLAVLPEAQCTLATDRPAGEVLQIVPGATAKFNVKATRTGDLKGAIKLAAEKLPNGITVKVATIAADKDEAEITVTTTKQTVVGLKENVVITGTIKVDKDTLTCAAPAVPIEIIAEPEEKK